MRFFFLRPPLTHLGSARTRAFPCRVLWKKNFIPRQDQVKLFATNQISNKSYINNTGHFALIHRSCLAKHGNGGSLQVLLSPRYFILLNRACLKQDNVYFKSLVVQDWRTYSMNTLSPNRWRS